MSHGVAGWTAASLPRFETVATCAQQTGMPALRMCCAAPPKPPLSAAKMSTFECVVYMHITPVTMLTLAVLIWFYIQLKLIWFRSKLI
jgi:hypothetical protein